MESKVSQAKKVVPPATGSRAPSSVCPACGAVARRMDARFCLACGRSLAEAYLPTDALRASYSAPRSRTLRSNEGGASVQRRKSYTSSISPARNINGASTTALAFVTYALVPYLGILFCPGAILMGGVGLYNSYRAPERGGRRASYIGVSLGFIILCVQIFLWWILYKIPEWSAR